MRCMLPLDRPIPAHLLRRPAPCPHAPCECVGCTKLALPACVYCGDPLCYVEGQWISVAKVN